MSSIHAKQIPTDATIANISNSDLRQRVLIARPMINNSNQFSNSRKYSLPSAMACQTSSIIKMRIMMKRRASTVQREMSEYFLRWLHPINSFSFIFALVLLVLFFFSLITSNFNSYLSSFLPFDFPFGAAPREVISKAPWIIMVMRRMKSLKSPD